LAPQILRKRKNLTCRLTPYALKEIEPLSTVWLLSLNKRKMEMEEQNLKKRKLEYTAKTSAIKEKYKNLLEKEDKIAKTRATMIKYFSSPWRNLDTFGTYSVSAFTVNSISKYPYVGVLA